MQSKKTTNRLFKSSSGKKLHGFTLAELIVVLAILAILSAVGVVVAVGFINKSKFDQNSQNAITVYQAAQTAVSQKVANGTIGDWVLNNFSSSDFSDNYFLKTVEGKAVLDEPNKAVHKVVNLTYNPGSSSNSLYELLNGYFYDDIVFSGTISVEFDISAVKQSDGSIGYSATVISAFYSKENTADNGWDTKCLGNALDGLPQRDYGYRHDTSYVGYYYGSKESVDGGPVPVALPGLQGTAIDFTMRNGETLDLTWALIGDTSHDANLKFTLKSEGTSLSPVIIEVNEKELLYSWQNSSEPKSVDYSQVIDNLPAFPVGTFASEKEDRKVVYEEIKYAAADGSLKVMNITKTSAEALAVVKCNGNSYQIPLIITFVEGDTREGYPSTGYLTYTLCLDCMMTRSDYESNSNDELFSITRFFGNTPTNISASVTGKVSGANIEETKATRAIDDPVAFDEVRMSAASKPTYCYILGADKCGVNDTDGKCVVNTLFGDGVRGSVSGTSYDSTSKKAEAAISTFRHLSNIRLIEDDVSANFTIIRNLNWYDKVTENNITYYVSDVRLFKRYGNTSSSQPSTHNTEGYNSSTLSLSPAFKNDLKVVSFPALPVIDINKSLTALNSCSINSVQLRKLSFDDSDTGRGLICENKGKITNIQTNNLSLVLNGTITNGSNSDYSTIAYTSEFTPADLTGSEKEIAVGGLIGLNSGEVGSADGIVRMSNCIVMTGNYWNNTDKYTYGTGGVIGANAGSSALISGELEINGNFVISGYKGVGGVIGFNNKSFTSKLTVNGTTAPSSDFNNLGFGSKNASCIISGWEFVGGAIGVTDASGIGNISVYYSGANDKSGIVRGGSCVGGAIGYNKTSVTGSVSVEGRADILGSGDWVGGAIGYNSATVNGVTVKYSSSSSVEGKQHVSGAVGYNAADITNGISVEYENAVSITGTQFVGGAIGENASGNVKSVSVAYTGENNDTLTISGTSYVGGAIGYSKSAIETVSVKCNTVIFGSGENIGGAIGCNEDTAPISDSVSVEGSTQITATGNYTGGAIGRNSAGVSAVSVKLTGSSSITGKEYVSGAVGYNVANISNGITVELGNTLSLTGTNYVGGAIGQIAAGNVKSVSVASADGSTGVLKINGTTLLGGAIGYNKSSVIETVSVKCSVDISGSGDNIGGAIGCNENTASITDRVSVAGRTNISTSGNYVGGAIGNNKAVVLGVVVDILSDSTIKGNEDTAGAIGYNAAGITEGVKATLEASSTVEGSKYVGGAIGQSVVSLTVVESSVYGVVKGSSDYIGGAIACTDASITTIKVEIGGSVVGDSDSSNFVGGAIGHHKTSVANLSVEYTGTGEVSGHDYVGGIIGKLDGNVPSNPISVDLTDGRTVKGNSYVGGIIGYNNVALTTVSATIRGEINGSGSGIGGAIGYNTKQITTISSSLSGSIKGTGENVGGVIGYNNANISEVSIVTTGSSSLVQGSSCVGGLIGYLYKSTINEPLSASFSSGTSIKGSSDGSCVGGLCGYITNDGNGNISINKAVNLTLNGVTVEGGTKVGGAFGYLYKTKINNSITITATDSSIKSESTDISDLGGAIGLTDEVTHNDNLTVTLNNSSVIGKGKYVGGIIGHNRSTQKNITITINADSFVQGRTTVGGAIGWAEGVKNDRGKMDSETVVINTAQAIRGVGTMGGAFGRIGLVPVGTKDESWPYIGNTTLEINTGVPFKQIEGSKEDQGYIGGAIGNISNANNIIKITLKGTGGSFNLADVGLNDSAVSKSILVSGKGPSIGGLVGNSGAEYSGQGVRFRDVDVSKSPSLYVVSEDGSDGIGGWIGSSKGFFRNGDSGTVTYTVNNVKLVYSDGGSGVGAFCGIVDNSVNINKAQNYAKVTVNLSGTAVHGGSNVGGAIGYMYAKYNGSLTVNSDDTTAISGTGSNIGGAVGFMNGTTYNADLTVNLIGSPITGGDNVGGAIGQMNKSNISKNLTLNITSGTSITGSSSVGGVCGYIVNKDKNTISISNKISFSLNDIIISGDNNIGGVYGTVEKTKFDKIINVSVSDSSITGSGSNIGGVIGQIVDCTISEGIGSNSSPVTLSTGTEISGNSNVGGAVGYIASGTISKGISVTINNSIVTGTLENAGGSVGCMTGGTINDGIKATLSVANISGVSKTGGSVGSVAGGTINGVVNETTEKSNVSGDDKVGGVVGSVTGGTLNDGVTVTLDNSKVSASDEYAGGAIGVMSDGTIKGVINVLLKNNTQIEATTEIGGAIGSLTKGTISGEIVVNADDSHIFGESKVGGSIGSVTGGQISGGINVTLNTSYVTGVSEIGGGIGSVDGSKNAVIIKNGIKVVLSEQSYIGDIKNDNGEGYSCIDAGGAIGYLANNAKDSKGNDVNPIQNGVVRVELDDTSMIFAGGENGGTDYGVGGVFGRLGSLDAGSKPDLITWNDKNNNTPYLSLYCASPEPSVYSASSPVGGLVGHMYSGKIWRSYSTAVVSGVDYVGGFIGYMDGGEIDTSYVSAHTVNGQYEAGSENVVGRNYVGGFIGYVDDKVTNIHQCYSLASVRGLNYIGGFFGYLDSNRTNIFSSTYCTGLVSWDEPEDPEAPPVVCYIGAYGGYVDSTSGVNVFTTSNVHTERNDVNKVLEASNSGIARVGGWSDTTVTEIDDNKLCWSPYSDTEWGYRYIRVRQKSLYNAEPFEEGLKEYANNFPYRTYISYSLGDESYFGEHIGDWPIYGESTLITIDANNTVISVNETAAFRYGESGFTLPTSAFTVVYTDPDTHEQHTLDSNEFKVMFENNDHVGNEAVYHVIGLTTGGYNGEVDGTFTIAPVNLSDAAVSVVINGGSEQTYTGAQITPSVTVVYHNSKTNKDVTIPSTEYSVSYGVNTEVGTSTGTITITAADGADCDGSRTSNFSIIPVDIANAVIELEQDSYTYTGREIKPVIVKVTVIGNEVPDTAYDVTYENNTDIGSEAKVVVTVKAAETNYTGSASTGFAIVPINIGEDDVVVDPTDYTYTGSDITPTVTVVVNGETLDPDTDYELSYPDGQDHIECATGLIVTITGKGNYTGTIDKTFNIIQASSGGEEGNNNDTTGETNEPATPATDGNPENAANGNAQEVDPSPENPDAVPPESNDSVAPENQNDPNDPNEPNDPTDSNDPTDPNESGDP